MLPRDLLGQSYRPSHGGYPDARPGMVAVRMSAAAAEKLAEACGLASHWAAALWDGEDVIALPVRRRAAVAAYEWLSWGREWLRHREARTTDG